MNNKIWVTGDFGSMAITPPVDFLEPTDRDGLVLGLYDTPKRGLFRKKTVQRSFTLSTTEILQHVAVYAEVGTGVNGWLMDKAYQAMRFDWAVLYMDFMWSQGEMNKWVAMAKTAACIASNNDLAEMLTGNKTAYVRADNATVPALARIVSNIMAMANDQRPTNTLIILNGMPEDDASMEAVTKMVAQCRAAKIGLVLRFQERKETDYQAMLDANVRTTVEFPRSSRSLGVCSIFPPCDTLGFKKLDK
jgi:hypothetical protein